MIITIKIYHIRSSRGERIQETMSQKYVTSSSAPNMDFTYAITQSNTHTHTYIFAHDPNQIRCENIQNDKV